MSADPFLTALSGLGPALLNALAAFEEVRRHLDPPRIGGLREALRALAERLRAARDTFRDATPPDGLGDLAAQLLQAADAAVAMGEAFCADALPHEAIPRVLGAMHEHCRAQALLYPLRKALPPVNSFFLEPAVRSRLAELDPAPRADPPTGIISARHPRGERGGFSLYVPEYYDATRAWPLVVALHGGSGNGDDFLWTWLIEARSRGVLLLSPTSLGSTWSLMGDDIDAPALRAMVEYVGEHWRVDATRILLTGLSDGATYTLLCGLQPATPFTHLAPISGVLHPANLMNGNLERARGRCIYLVHGGLDWMFPIATARLAHHELARAGADIVFREIADLSHAYPREQNGPILEWMDSSLKAES
ncbi:MAG: phospholipase [bacterium]